MELDKSNIKQLQVDIDPNKEQVHIGRTIRRKSKVSHDELYEREIKVENLETLPKSEKNNEFFRERLRSIQNLDINGEDRDQEYSNVNLRPKFFEFKRLNNKKEKDELCSGCSSHTSSIGSATSTLGTKETSLDVSYLKNMVGAALKLSLAEVVMKKPEDPIQYLGQLLIKFRLNHEEDAAKRLEMQELVKERKRLEDDRLREMYRSEANATVLEMIIKAQERNIEEQEEEQEEEEEEANTDNEISVINLE